MNPRIAEAHPAPLMPFPANTRLSTPQAVALEARRARDAMLMAALRDLFGGTAARLLAWRERRRAIAELRMLSDRELSDIGLSRETIALAVTANPAEEAALVAGTSPMVAANDVVAARAAA
ncbi:DUF1127 domain-containing protein [Roseomonas sp. CCTCC AB2023176]|uniref:DUF1127 domain-containing protein n=1 Tax=Roseomonas sp. CCTCC AB2023176 TaxID=3342640 RepID=UPI0035D92107